jgi:S1-C subfamily serine protease
MRKYALLSLGFLLLLVLNNVACYRLYNYLNPPIKPVTESYLTQNYTKLLDSTITVRSISDTEEGLGTGIWYKDGYIVTAYHVVENSKAVFVTRDGIAKALQCSVYAYDPVLDIAIIKVNNADQQNIALFKPTYLNWANSNEQQVGETVWAIGNPVGITDTITQGIVSYTSRIFQTINPFSRYIQTDASINEGNSGGDVINANGRIVGMSDFINTNGGNGSIGLNFAIQSDIVKQTVDNLLSGKKIVHPYIGIALSFINNEAVMSPDPTGPAKAINPYDELISANGRTFSSIAEWTNFEESLTVGQFVTIKLDRINTDGSETIKIVEVEVINSPIFIDRVQ